MMTINERVQLISRNTVEVVTLEELKRKFEIKSNPKGYIGFECSGFMHIGMGLIVGKKIKDAVDAGVDFIILLADWHAWINNKLGGDMSNIKLAGEYLIHGFTALGIPKNKVKYIWASDIVDNVEYWETVIKIGKKASLRRVLRALPILGRRDTDEIKEVSWLIYPLMQVTDIFMLNLDMAFAGIDQRKAHMLARDVAKYINKKPPICVHTPLLPSLYSPVPKKTEEKIFSKMSKSKAELGIFIHDEEDEIRRKIMKSYCPPNDYTSNPLYYLLKYIILPYLKDENKNFIVKGKKGEVEINTIDQFETLYSNGEIHPYDFKLAIIYYLNEILAPVRKYFDVHGEIIEELKKIIYKK